MQSPNLFSDAMNVARMSFMGAEVDKGRQETERADYQCAESPGSFRQHRSRVRPHPGVSDRTADPQLGPKIHQTRISGLRHKQEINLLRGQVDVSLTGQHTVLGIEYKGPAGG